MMKIVCPTCDAAYEVPDSRLMLNQTVRCARCSTDWAPAARTPVAGPVPLPSAFAIPEPPSEPELQPKPAALFEPTPVEAIAETPQAQPRPASRSGSLVIAGWIISFVALAALGWAAVTWRTAIMHAWPPSERLYGMLGMPMLP